MITYEVVTKGFDKQITKLKGFNRIANKHLRRASLESTTLLERKWKMDAPVDTGRYRSSIAGRVRTLGSEVVGIVGTNVRSATGFPYPAALEESKRYHYRTGPRAGMPTMGRVKRLFKVAQEQILNSFKKARDRIIKELEI
jgi:hypothetical protein